MHAFQQIHLLVLMAGECKVV